MRPAAILAAVVAAMVAVRPGAAEGPIIDVRKEADRRIAVGIGKFPTVPAEEVGSPPGGVVAFDLELSGWFEPVRPTMLPPRSLEDWERKGAEVVCDLVLSGPVLIGTVRDVGSGDILFDQEYREGELRDRIHRFSDDVVRNLTGERGLARGRILCEWDPGEGKRLVVMDIDGFRMRELTGEGVLELSPRWSRDGTRAVYTSYSSGFPDVYIHDLIAGGRERVAHYEGLNAQGDLGPDGRKLVLTLSHAGNPEIYSKDLESGKIWRLTNHRATDSSPVWSPDGRRIAFVSDRSGNPQVYVMDDDSSNLQRVTYRGNYNTAPAWSPEGERIAYCALRPDGFQIQIVNLSDRSVITATEGGGCEDPSWSPDGRAILYSRKTGGRTDLYITNLSERKALRISRGSGRYTGPDWSPFR